MLVGCWTIGVRSLSCQGIEEYPNHQISPSLNAKKEMTRTWQIPFMYPFVLKESRHYCDVISAVSELSP